MTQTSRKDKLMALSLDDLTLGEIDTIESLAQCSIDELADETRPKGKVLAAFAYVAKRRVNPEYTWNEALGLTMSELDGLVNLGDDDANLPSPKDHLPKQPRKRAPKD